MALKRLLRKLTAPVEDLDEENLREFCTSRPGVTSMCDLEPREEVTVVGEITSLRIVPRPDGSRWLEATVSDGTGTMVAMWTGRRQIAGFKPGQRLVLSGRGSPPGAGGRLVIVNPSYELL